MLNLLLSRPLSVLLLIQLSCWCTPPLLAQDPPQTGVIRLRLVDEPESYLGMDTKALEDRLCSSPPPLLARGPIRVEPRLVVVNDGGGVRGETFVLDLIEASLPTATHPGIARLKPAVMSLKGPGTFTAWCGTFTYQLLLHPQGVQPTSTLALLASGVTGAPLRLQGVLAAQGLLRFELGGLFAYAEARPLALLFDGLALVVPPGTPLLPEESNLILFAERTDEGLVSRPTCAPELQTTGRFCFETPAALLEALNEG